MNRLVVMCALLTAYAPQCAVAGEVRASPETWTSAWTLDPLVLLNLGVLALLYSQGIRSHWRRAPGRPLVRGGHVAAFYAALLVIGLVLLSPLDAMGADLSSAHMVQHMLLTIVAAPLVVLGAPAYVMAWSIPRRTLHWLTGEAWLRRLLWQPWLTWTLYAVVLWMWHHPVLYQGALRDALVHDAQHLSFFLAAVLYWRVILEPLARRRRLPVLTTIVYLFTTSLHATVLGVFMTLSPAAWYGDYADTTSLWGYTPLEDQQLAGLLMWGPSCLVYPAVAAGLFGHWLANMSVSRERHPVSSEDACSTARA